MHLFKGQDINIYAIAVIYHSSVLFGTCIVFITVSFLRVVVAESIFFEIKTNKIQ